VGGHQQDSGQDAQQGGEASGDPRRPAAVESILAACGPFQHELLIGEEQVGAGGPAAARSAADALAQAPGAAYLMAATPEAAAAALAAVATCPEVSAVAVASWTGRAVGVHFTPAQGSRFYGASAARKLVGAGRAEAVAMGDADNDIPLMAAAGLRIAVAASPALTARAHLIAPSAAEDGLAVVLETLALDPTRAALRCGHACHGPTGPETGPPALSTPVGPRAPVGSQGP